jgi:heat shock protein HslJ
MVSRKARSAWGFAIGAMVLFGCASSGGDADITGRAWQLTELRGAPVIEGTIVDMSITADEVSGSSGCNRYFGTVTVEDGNITFGPEVGGSMMACEDPVMTQERVFLETLTEAETYEMAGDELSLLDGAGAVVASFR